MVSAKAHMLTDKRGLIESLRVDKMAGRDAQELDRGKREKVI